MSFRTIKDGQPITPDSLNRFVGNGAATWVSSTSCSGTSTYNIDNSINNSGLSRWTRVVISNVVASSATGLFLRAIDSLGNVISTNVYQIGYYGCNAAGALDSNWSTATSVWNVGPISNAVANFNCDFYHLNGGSQGMSMIGMGAGGNAAYPNLSMYGGWCNYTTRSMRGFQLVSYLGVNFSCKVNVYQYRRG